MDEQTQGGRAPAALAEQLAQAGLLLEEPVSLVSPRAAPSTGEGGAGCWGSVGAEGQSNPSRGRHPSTPEQKGTTQVREGGVGEAGGRAGDRRGRGGGRVRHRTAQPPLEQHRRVGPAPLPLTGAADRRNTGGPPPHHRKANLEPHSQAFCRRVRSRPTKPTH